MGTGRLRTDVYSLSHVFVPLLQLPWKVVASSMQLKVLVSLKTLVADFANEPVGSRQSLWRQSNHLSIRVFRERERERER